MQAPAAAVPDDQLDHATQRTSMLLRLPSLVLVAMCTGARGVDFLQGLTDTAPVSCPRALAPGTACGAGAVCCPIFMSQSGMGCCHLEGGVCCPKTPTTQMCCPKGTTCHVKDYSADCVPDAGGDNETGIMVCTPGAKLPPSSSKLPSVIVIGDSVSEGIEPVLAANLSDVAFVQHSPWSGGGGADDVNNGVNCEEEFLRTALYQPAKWDLISFNFGLHDNSDNSSAALTEYETALTNFTKRLVATGSKLLYISTTPFMPQEYYGNLCVPELNTIAQKVMKKYRVPYADVYSWIMQKCGDGKPYASCPLCDNEPWKNPGAPVTDQFECAWGCVNDQAGAHCGYHYTREGYDYIVDFLGPIYEAQLGL